MTDRHERERKILEEFRTSGSVDGLIREYWNMVYFVVRNTLSFYKIRYTREDIEDLRNEVFLQLFVNDFRRLKQYNEEQGRLENWIKLIANQTTLNEIRKKGWLDLTKRNFRVSLEDIEEFLKYEEKSSTEQEEMLKSAIEKLPSGDKRILKFYFADISLNEIANLLGKSYGAAAKAVHDAKKRLKQLCKGELP